MKKKDLTILFGLFLLLFICISNSFSQDSPYRFVDSTMRNYREKIKDQNDLYKLTYFIRNSFKSDSIRLRACFIWITENIGYDIRSYIREDPRAGQLEYVLKRKKAICGGYANLLKYMCDGLNIKCEIVNGYARAGKRSIYLSYFPTRPNHAWNAVFINNTWRLIDPTWAAGYTNDTDEEKDMKYTKNFNETYYFTPPEKFILNHYPGDFRFLFLEKSISQQRFIKQPLFTSYFLADSVERVIPDSSLIKTSVGDTIIFRFNKGSEINEFCAFSEKSEKAYHRSFLKKRGDWFEFHYPVKISGIYELYICSFHHEKSKPLVGYRLEVK